MANSADDGKPTLSRRDLLKRVGIAGAVVSVPPVLLPSEAFPAQTGPSPGTGALREALETFTAAEAETVEAIAARLIPTDASGPGATEARATRYIDRALGGALASSREAYRNGLSAIDSYSRATKGARFSELPGSDQDAVLQAMEENAATGFTPNAAAFFNLVRTHTIQGTFCDPYYGGNANFVGWDLIGYPGLRLTVSERDQRLDPGLKPTRKSAYDEAMFSSRRPARAGREGEHEGSPERKDTHHGD
jgi:gluconate 2-dehydrogenase gamma chain